MPTKSTYRYRHTMHTGRMQEGTALLFSMVFLLLLTILGLSALGGSKMELRMAQNYQLDNDGFNFTESAIDTILYRAQVNETNYTQAADIVDDVVGTGNASSTTLNAAALDPNDRLKSADPSSTVTVSYLATLPMCPGGGSCNEYTVTATTTIPDTSVNETHTQIVRVPIPTVGNI